MKVEEQVAVRAHPFLSGKEGAAAASTEATTRQDREIEAIREAVGLFLLDLTEEALLDRLVEIVVGTLPAAGRGFIGLVERASGHLRVRSVCGYADPAMWKAARVAPEGPLTLAMAERRLLLLAGQEGGPLREGTAGPEELSWAIAPLAHQDQGVGVLVLQAAPGRTFFPEDRPFLEVMAGLTMLVLERVRLEKELDRITWRDPLTGLYNLHGLLALGRQELAYAAQHGRPLALLGVDIDRMEAVNRAHGFAVGNQVLREVGRRLQRNLRAADLLARNEGDCFAALVLALSSVEARRVAERLCQVVAQAPIRTSAGPVPVTVSVGVASSEHLHSGLEELLERAERATRSVKEAGGNGVACWPEGGRPRGELPAG